MNNQINNGLKAEIPSPYDSTDSVYWNKLNDALNNLLSNEDFKTLILDGYLKEKAVANVSLLASEYIVSTGKRSDVMESLIAISRLQDYFMYVQNMGKPVSDYDDDIEQGQ